ncbi:MAG: ABC transporter ATP-binding protein [Lachnospiraceae bacterium]|nr:ABC transporter ATP-binding protein [Lachnospiraceae bacterium]
MIRVENVEKSFDGLKALDGISLTVEKGSVYGLVGPNGAGKSTIIKHLTGVYKADKGEVSINNEPVYENPRIKEKISYIPDELFFINRASVKQMMKFYRNIYKDFDMERFEKLKDVFSSININKPICKLSKGMQKQAAFWLTICCNPEIIILDEPVDGLDPVMRRQVWSLLLQDVAERSTTVLVSSHNLRELEDVCDTVGILNKGKMMLEKSLSSLQGSVVKYQVVYNGEAPELKDKLDILHVQNNASVYTYIIRGEAKMIEDVLRSFQPVILDVIPLTLEEIFIYELGGEDYGIKDIII